MAIQYTFSNTDDLLFVTSSGFDETPEEVLAYGMAVMEAALACNARSILCDESALEYRLSIVDTYTTAAALAEAAPHLARIALVCQPQVYQDAAFWETVVVNRGLMARVFRELETAKEWLANGETGIGTV